MKKLVLMFALVSLFFIGGCGNSGAPECSSKDVQKMVIQIATTELANNLVRQTTGFANSMDELQKAVDMEMISSKEFKEITKKINSRMKNYSISLEGTRTESCNDKTKKCECGANLVVSEPNGGSKSIPIKYTAQYTDDGKIYVEVFGL